MCACGCACVYVGESTGMLPLRDLNECVHGCACTCVFGLMHAVCRPICMCACEHRHLKGACRAWGRVCGRRVALWVRMPLPFSELAGVVHGYQAALLEAAGLGRPYSCSYPSHPVQARDPGNGLLPAHTLASITAEKKLPKSSAGWKQGRHGRRQSRRQRERPPRTHPPASNPISPPLGRGGEACATHVAHFDPAALLQQPPFDLRPQRAGHVEAGAGRALLAAVLEG